MSVAHKSMGLAIIIIVIISSIIIIIIILIIIIIVRSHFGSCQGKQLGMFGFGQGCLAGSSRCILCPGQLLALGALQGLWLRTLVVRVVVELGG